LEKKRRNEDRMLNNRERGCEGKKRQTGRTRIDREGDKD
jgi:hypothetical protein